MEFAIISEDYGDLADGEWGDYGSDEWFEALTGIADDAQAWCDEAEAFGESLSTEYIVCKVICAMRTQHRYHRHPDHDWRLCGVCSPSLLDLTADADSGFGSTKPID
jgi:hypothetical protein